MSFFNRGHRSHRPLLLIAVVVIVGLFLYFGGASQLGLARGGGKSFDLGASTPFGGGWLPLLVALGIGVLVGWTIARRR